MPFARGNRGGVSGGGAEPSVELKDEEDVQKYEGVEDVQRERAPV